MKVKICEIRLDSLRLDRKYSEKLRGYIGNKYRENNILHNHSTHDNKFIYRYPLVQYKVINKVPVILGINDGADIAANIGLKENQFILDDLKYDCCEKTIKKFDGEFGVTDDYVEYEFITPWIALNQKNIDSYNNGSNIEKEEILKRVLIGNLISISKGLNYTVEEKLVAWIDFNECDVMLKWVKHAGFTGRFKVNFNIPDHLGLGKSVSRGFGTIQRV